MLLIGHNLFLISTQSNNEAICMSQQFNALTKETCVHSNLAKGHIADLSPLMAAKGFVWSWPPSNTWFLGPTRLSPLPQNSISIGSAIFAQLSHAPNSSTHTEDRHTYIHTDHATWNSCSNRRRILCTACRQCGPKIKAINIILLCVWSTYSRVFLLHLRWRMH